MKTFLISSFAPARPARLLTVAVAGACLALTSACGPREATVTADAQPTESTAANDPLPVTRGGTGEGSDPATQGGSGMFAADPGDPASAAARTNHRGEPLPTQEWDGVAFGQKHESAFTTPSDTAAAGEPTTGGTEVAFSDSSSGDLEARIRQELRTASTELALTADQVDAIDVTVTGETVRLSGEVPNPEQVEQRVRQITGVSVIDNRLQSAAAE